jgi:hypothetical protein
MASAADSSGYGNSGMGGSPWGQAPYGSAPWEHPEWGYRQWLWASKPLWIAATILGFILFWPLGVVLLALMIGARRMGFLGCGRRGWMPGGYQQTGHTPGGYPPGGGWQGGGWQGGGAPPWAGWRSFWCGGGQQRQAQPAGPGSGNRAFDEYRAETLRRLEEEQKEFGAFLERLRFAKDKAEFDQFMAELRQRPPSSPEHPMPAPQG